MQPLTLFKRPAAVSVVAASVMIFSSQAQAQDITRNPAQSMPQPREVSKVEAQELTERLGTRFQKEPGKEVQFLAAGAYRFVSTPHFSYMERTDTGSVAFENPNYGIATKPLDEAALNRKTLLPRLEAVLRKTGLDITGMRFSRFQDEFAAAAEPKKLSRDFDPRKAGMHVARTVVYGREIEGLPIFGSELIVGMMPEGDIGRLRMHSPKIDPGLIAKAKKLQAAVGAKSWTVPRSLRSKDTKILEMRAGIGHSGFADPLFKAAAVVRVLYRTQSPDREYPLQTTGYKCFNQAGEEITFHAFPRLPGTPQASKPQVGETK